MLGVLYEKVLNLEEIANLERDKWNYLLKSENKDDLLYHTILNINSKGKILQNRKKRWKKLWRKY